MATYTFKPYYSYNGPTHSQPFRERLTDAEAQKNIAFFLENFESHFAGSDAVVVKDGDGSVVLTTSMSRDQVNAIVKGFLNYLDLFADHSYKP